jgi:hypothetical protein
MESYYWKRSHKWRTFLVLLGLAFLVSLSGIASWPDELRGMRYVNEQDEFYRYVAQQLAEPSICGKIPWSVKSPGGVFLEPSYYRSDCYDFIAGRTRNPWLCWKVRRLGAFHLFNQQTSALSCLRDAWRGMNAGVGVSPDTLIGFFAKLGYDPDRIQDEGITPPVVNLRDVYTQLTARPDVVTRIEKSIGPASANSLPTAIDTTNTAYLADMAALVTKDPRWCRRIPDDLPLASQRAGFSTWCVFTVASNTKNLALCREIPIPANQRDPRMSLQAMCLFQAGSPYPSGKYGPEMPDEDGITSLVTMLGYEIPTAKDLPPGEIYAAYDRFLDELNKRSDAQHVAARKRFVDRVLSLP